MNKIFKLYFVSRFGGKWIWFSKVMNLYVILCTFVVISVRICSAADEKVEVKSSYNEISENSYKFGYGINDIEETNYNYKFNKGTI